MVPQVGLEPTRISPLASKTSVATITPPGQTKKEIFKERCCLTAYVSIVQSI